MYDGELREQSTGVSVIASALADVARRLQFRVEVVSLSPTHSFAKTPAASIELLAGLGVAGDAHCGATDQHRLRTRADAPPNLRQLHLFSGEVMDELNAAGFPVVAGAIGENVLTRGVDLMALPLGARLVFPSGATARLTGRRTPCRKLDRIQPGLMKTLAGGTSGRWGENAFAGVMAVVERDGRVSVGDQAFIAPPPLPHRALPTL